MKFLPVGAVLFHAYGWTDRNDEANNRFSQCFRHKPYDENWYNFLISRVPNAQSVF